MRSGKSFSKSVIILFIVESLYQVCSFTTGNSQFTQLLYNQGFSVGQVSFLGIAGTVGYVMVLLGGVVFGNKVKSSKKWVMISYLNFLVSIAKFALINNLSIPLGYQTVLILCCNFVCKFLDGFRLIFIYRLSLHIMDGETYEKYLPLQTVFMGILTVLCSVASTFLVARMDTKEYVNLNLIISMVLSVVCLAFIPFIKSSGEEKVPATTSLKAIAKELNYPMLVPDILKQFGTAVLSTTVAFSVIYQINTNLFLSVIDVATYLSLVIAPLLVRVFSKHITKIFKVLIPLSLLTLAGFYFAGTKKIIPLYIACAFSANLIIYFWGTSTPLIWVKKVEKDKTPARSSAIQLVTQITGIATAALNGAFLESSFSYVLYFIGGVCLLLSLLAYIRYANNPEDRLFGSGKPQEEETDKTE